MERRLPIVSFGTQSSISISLKEKSLMPIYALFIIQQEQHKYTYVIIIILTAMCSVPKWYSAIPLRGYNKDYCMRNIDTLAYVHWRPLKMGSSPSALFFIA